MAEKKNFSMTVQRETFAKDSDIQLVQLVGNDLTRNQIAVKLKLSPRTIEAKIDILRHSFNCRSVVGLVMLFKRNNLID